MSIIKKQAEDLIKQSIDYLVSKNIPISNSNIDNVHKKIIRDIDLGFPYLMPVNFSYRENLDKAKYEYFFKTLEKDILNLFDSKKENLDNIEKNLLLHENNKYLIDKHLKNLLFSLYEFEQYENVDYKYQFNFNEMNSLDYLSELRTTADVDLIKMNATNQVVKEDIFKLEEIEGRIIPKTIVENDDTIGNFEGIYNKDDSIYKYHATTTTSDDFILIIDITNRRKDKMVNELILEVKKDTNVNLLVSTNGSEFISQDNILIEDYHIFNINQEINNIRLKLSIPYDFIKDDLYNFNFYISKILINKNIYFKDNVIITKECDVKENILVTSDYTKSNVGQINFYYSDEGNDNWSPLRLNEIIKLPKNILSERFVNKKNSSIYGINFKSAYSIATVELDENETIDVYAGVDSEFINCYISNDDIAYEHFSFDTKDPDYTYFNKNEHDYKIDIVPDTRSVYIKIEKYFYIDDMDDIDKNAVNDDDLYAYIKLNENFDDYNFSTNETNPEKLYINNMKVQINNDDKINIMLNDFNIEKIELASLKPGLNKITTYMHCYNTRFIVDNNIFKDYKFSLPKVIITKKHYFDSLDDSFNKDSVIINEFKYNFGLKLEENTTYANINQFYIDDEGVVFTVLNPSNSNGMDDKIGTEFLITKKKRNQRVSLMAEMLTEDENKTNVIYNFNLLSGELLSK